MEEKRNKNGQTLAEFLAAYDASKYERPSVTVDAVMLHDGKVLLIKRGDHPFIGTWALPGGFVEPNETTDSAVRRELCEETGISRVSAKQLRVWSDPARDPRTRVITVAYLISFIDEVQLPSAGDDAADAVWFDLEYGLSVDSDTQDTLYIRLTHGYELLEYSVLRTLSPYGEDAAYKMLTDTPIASDHALIIADALYKILDKKL